MWEAPNFIDIRYPLAFAEGYRDDEKLKRLFNSILNIKNTDWKLSMLQIGVNKQNQGPYSNIANIYRHIENQGLTIDEWTNYVRYET